MDANTLVLGAYVLTAGVALGSVFLPGAGLTGRLLCGATGLAVGGATATAYLRHGALSAHPAALIVPAALLGYLIVTSYRRQAGEEADWYSTGRRGADLADLTDRADPDPQVERRGPGRRVLPGEYGSVPINHLPPPHDPWAALYASVERELLRGGTARHRPTSPLAPVPAPVPAAYAARKAAYAARQAEFTAWQTVVDAEQPPVR